MMAHRRSIVAIAICLLAGCGARPSGGKIPVRIAVGGLGQQVYLAASLAQNLGFYDAEGLAVSLQDFPGGQKSLEALLGGSTDVVCGFYDHTIEMAAKGQDLRAFVFLLRYPGLVAVARPGIARIEDLKGKIAGVTAAGSSSHLFLNYLLTEHGIRPDEVSISSIGTTATAVGAIERGKIDAAIVTDPAVDIVLKQMPKLTILADTRTGEGVRRSFGVDTYPATVLYSTTSWIEGNRDTASRLARAMGRTLAWMRAHSAGEIRARLGEPFQYADPETELAALGYMKTMLSPDGRMAPESAAAVLKVLSTSLDEVRRAKIDLAGTYTNEFVESIK